MNSLQIQQASDRNEAGRPVGGTDRPVQTGFMVTVSEGKAAGGTRAVRRMENGDPDHVMLWGSEDSDGRDANRR